jgi:hypothetical protein
MGRIRHLRLHLSRPAETGLSPEELTVLLGEQKTEDRRQKTEVRSQKSEVRSQKSEVRKLKT